MAASAWKVYFDKSELSTLKELVNKHYGYIYNGETEVSCLEEKIDMMIECLGMTKSNTIEAVLFQ